MKDMLGSSPGSPEVAGPSGSAMVTEQAIRDPRREEQTEYEWVIKSDSRANPEGGERDVRGTP